MYDQYLPVLISALTILLIKCWNPEVLQSQKDGRPTGYPSYMMVALVSLLAGLLAAYLMQGSGKKMKNYLSI
jgi:hypothetical protein